MLWIWFHVPLKHRYIKIHTIEISNLSTWNSPGPMTTVWLEMIKKFSREIFDDELCMIYNYQVTDRISLWKTLRIGRFFFSRWNLPWLWSFRNPNVEWYCSMHDPGNTKNIYSSQYKIREIRLQRAQCGNFGLTTFWQKFSEINPFIKESYDELIWRKFFKWDYIFHFSKLCSTKWKFQNVREIIFSSFRVSTKKTAFELSKSIPEVDFT